LVCNAINQFIPTIMKSLLIALVFLSTINVFTQNNTVVEFKELNQEFDFTSNKIKIQLQVINASEYAKKTTIPMTFQLFCTNIDDESYFGITKTKGYSVILEHTDNGIELEFSINEKILQSYNSLTFILKKKGVNSNFEVSNSGHTVTLLPKNHNKSEVSLVELKSFKQLDLNLNELETIKIPFNLKINGYEIGEEDNAIAKIRLNGKNEKEFSFYGKSFKDEYVLNRKDNKGYFDSLVNLISIKESLVLKIAKLSSNSKKELVINKKSDSILVKVKKKDVEKARYDIFLGANFDLQNNLQATSFYSEVAIFLPDLPDIFKSKSRKTNIMAGIYKNSNSTNLEESRRTQLISEIVNTTSDTITYSTKLVNTIPNVSIENLGLYGAIVRDLDVSENKKFRSYIGLHLEVIERRETYTYKSNDLINLGQTNISIQELQANDSLQLVLAKPKTISRKYYDSYYGMSLPMYYTSRSQDFEAFINPIAGVGYPGLRIENSDKHKIFIACNFHLIVSEKDILGIKLSGGIRKYFNFEQDPLININLSTRINLSGALKKEKD
jgi:hypothetical protein